MQLYEGNFDNILYSAGGSVITLLDILTSTFDTFKDSTTFKGREVHFCKRSQLLIADLWGALEG